MRGVWIVLCILVIEWILFMLLNILIFNFSRITIVENRLIDQLIKLIVNTIIGAGWLYSWMKLGEKFYSKVKSRT